MPKLQEILLLSDKGYKDLKQATIAVTITNFSLILPFFVTMQIFGEIVKPFTGEEISWNRIWLLFALGIVSAIIVFFSHKNDYKKTYVVSYLEAENARVAMAEHIRKLPMSVFNSKDLSEITTNMMADCAIFEHVLSHVVPQLLANLISLTVTCTAMAIFDWRMALAVFCSVPIAFFIIFASKKLQSKFGNAHSDAKLSVSNQVQEYIEGIKVIKACRLSGSSFTVLENALKTMRNLAIKFEFITGVFVTSSQVIIQAGVGATIFLGTYLLTESKIELMTLLAFLLIVTRIYGGILVELTLLPELFYHQIAIGRRKKLTATSIMEGDTDTKLKSYDIDFENVTFKYNKEGNDTIKNMSVSIPSNGITALVGPSGSGKSTVSRLIARFWDVNNGVIKIGGVDIKTLDPEHLMSYMSFVFQDVVLFNDTIYNNILIGDMNATKEEVIAAAKAACCDDFIDKLPNGYDTILGENGSTLSGGERQRLSVARALLKNAPIVLLDEATASLDPENEVSIQKAISSLIENRTVIVIAHRLKTITEANKIIVLDNGEMVEEGTHNFLMEKDGLYKRLFTIQQESLGWSI